MDGYKALELLGLSQGFTSDDLKRAYKLQAKKKHPDLGGTHEGFTELTRAYEFLLTNPVVKRKAVYTHVSIFNVVEVN